MIKRAIQIKPLLERGKALILYGPRQVGKTTLVEDFLQSTELKYRLFSGEDLSFANDFAKCDLRIIKNMIGDNELLVIDEGQKVENIRRALKLTVDQIPNISIIVTGSSSFDLANATDEPLTGRKNVVTLYPVAMVELAQQRTPYELENRLSEYLIYGSYPNVITYDTIEKKQQRITEIANAYLIKDILEFHKVRKSETVIRLLKLLAFQIGSEVSTSELGKQLELNHKTVNRYLDLLEKSFVIFRVDGLSRNLRKEVTKMSKYYFYDLGIRNALISNFNQLDTRDDVGMLWENFAMIERMKKNAYSGKGVNYYFWRTYDQQEIDFVEERDGNLHGYEFKWKDDDIQPPKEWKRAYPSATFDVITSKNFLTFVT